MSRLRSLIDAGVHFGHQRSRWNPKMKPYIWGIRNGVHLIDVSKTDRLLDVAAEFLKEITLSNAQVLWLGTKKPAQKIVAEVAEKTGMPWVTHRWIGGTLTNRNEVRKSVAKLLHLKDLLQKERPGFYTKKELNAFQKEAGQLEKNLAGIVDLEWPLGALVVVDVRKEQSAIREAFYCGIPIIAICDTNVDPTLIDYVIPGNDDSTKSIKILLDRLADKVAEAVKEAKSAKKADKEEAEKPMGKEPARDTTAEKAPVKKSTPAKEGKHDGKEGANTKKLAKGVEKKTPDKAAQKQPEKIAPKASKVSKPGTATKTETKDEAKAKAAAEKGSPPKAATSSNVAASKPKPASEKSVPSKTPQKREAADSKKTADKTSSSKTKK